VDESSKTNPARNKNQPSIQTLQEHAKVCRRIYVLLYWKSVCLYYQHRKSENLGLYLLMYKIGVVLLWKDTAFSEVLTNSTGYQKYSDTFQTQDMTIVFKDQVLLLIFGNLGTIQFKW